MRVLRLYNPFPNGFAPENSEQAQAALEDYQAVYDAIASGKAHVRFIDGDRKGSIARLIWEGVNDRPKFVGNYYSSSWNKNLTQKMGNSYFSCIATWDGRRNKVKVFLPDHETEFLLDYEGPTIWEKFDTKAAKTDILKNPDQKDINGNVLNVGDRVLYINARYGSRMTLEEGTIIEFAVSVNSKGHTVATIIESKTGEQSSLQYPESMVYKF